MHILHIRNIEKVLRASAAHTQDTALAFTVLHLLAVHAARVDLAVLPLVLPVSEKRIVSEGFFASKCERWERGRETWAMYLPVGVGIHVRVVYFAAGFDEAGEEGCEGEEDDCGLHCWVWFGFGLIRNMLLLWRVE